jgi:hypothetical protein
MRCIRVVVGRDGAGRGGAGGMCSEQEGCHDPPAPEEGGGKGPSSFAPDLAPSQPASGGISASISPRGGWGEGGARRVYTG